MAPVSDMFLRSVGYNSDDGNDVPSSQDRDCNPRSGEGGIEVDQILPIGNPGSSSLPKDSSQVQPLSRPPSPPSPPNFSGWAPCPVCTYKQRKVAPPDVGTEAELPIASTPMSPTQATRLEAANLLQRKRRFEEHLRLVRTDPELTYLEMSWEEFLSQVPAEEDEFGPDEDLTTIYSDCMELPYSRKEQMKEWLLRANRYETVQRSKRQRSELKPHV